jgi:copper chaperone CopZ
MADTIPQHFSTEFTTNWIQRVQQTKARLDAFVVDDCDDIAITTALGPVMTGELGATSTPFDTTNQWIGKGGVVGASTGTATGLTIGKLLTVREILSTSEVEDGAPIVFVCGPKEITNLLNTTKVTSADYASVKALANGTIDTFMGFKFVVNNRLTVAASIRTCVAWVKGAIKRTKGSMSTDISIRKDLSMATQIYSMWNLGATRVYDEGVVQVDCDESAAQPS